MNNLFGKLLLTALMGACAQLGALAVMIGYQKRNASHKTNNAKNNNNVIDVDCK